MKLTKRLLCLMLAMTLTFALCACGNKKEDKKEDKKTDNSTPSTQATTDPWNGNLEGDNQFNDAELDWG